MWRRDGAESALICFGRILGRDGSKGKLQNVHIFRTETEEYYGDEILYVEGAPWDFK